MNASLGVQRLTTHVNFSAAACIAIFCGTSAGAHAAAPAPVLLNYTNHWAGNTGGKGGHDENANDISNFVVDFGVLNASDVDWQMAPYVPLVVTKS
jgi:hypothetical protein